MTLLLTALQVPWSRPDAFRELARAEMGARFGTPLAPARVPGHPFRFDLVSEDGTLVGAVLPPAARTTRAMSSAQRAELSEKVLLLTLAPAQQRVLVVGEPRERLEPWLTVYGGLARDIEFWQLAGPGALQRLLV